MRLHGRARSPEVGEGRARRWVIDHEIRQVVEVYGGMTGGQHDDVTRSSTPSPDLWASMNNRSAAT
jgi:hypothetical protein